MAFTDFEESWIGSGSASMVITRYRSFSPKNNIPPIGFQDGAS